MFPYISLHFRRLTVFCIWEGKHHVKPEFLLHSPSLSSSLVGPLSHFIIFHSTNIISRRKETKEKDLKTSPTQTTKFKK